MAKTFFKGVCVNRCIHNRGLHGYGPGPPREPYPAQQETDDFSIWQMRDDFSNASSWASKREVIFPIGQAELGYKKGKANNIAHQSGLSKKMKFSNWWRKV